MQTSRIRMALMAATLILSLTAGLSSVAQAVDLSAGVGAGATPDYEGSDDYAPTLVPFLSAAWPNHLSFSLVGNRGNANLIPSPMWRGGLAGEYIPERADVNSSAVDNMEDVGASFMAGGFLGLEYEEWSASVEAMKDMANGNDGVIVRLNGGYRLSVDKSLTLGLGVFATWADNNYMDAYFSVNSADARRGGLLMYDAESGFKDVGGSVVATYKMGENWGLKGIASYKRLVNDAADSPVVDEEGSANQFAASVLAYYAF